MYIKLHAMDAVSSMLAKTSWNVTTRISEHQKINSTLGQHLVECCGTAHYIEWEILDANRGSEERMTMKAIYNKKLKPQLKTRNKFCGGIDIEVLVVIQLTLFLKFKKYSY